MSEPVFDDETRRIIKALRGSFRRAASDEGGAALRSKRVGRGEEFHDHRDYQEGDDLRHIDWNLYGRLDELQVKRFRAEADLELRILLDRSASMALGKPSKSLIAARLAGALAAVLLAGARDLELRALAPGLPRIGAAARGVAAIEGLFAAIEALPEPQGRADLKAAAAELSAGRNRLVLVVSDFLDDPGQLAGLLAARAARCDLVLIGVLAPDELDFEAGGFVEFVDVEGGAALELAVDEEMVTSYRRLLEEHIERLESLAAAHGARFILLRSDLDLAEAMRTIFLRGGLGR